MIICKTCLERDYSNTVNDSDMLPNTCEVCSKEEPCALIPNSTLIFKQYESPGYRGEPVMIGFTPESAKSGTSTAQTTFEKIKDSSKKTKKEKISKKEEIPLTPSESIPHETIVLPDVINTKLAEQNVTEAILVEMETNFLQLTITGFDDKEGYEAVNRARIACKNLRVLGVKICKEGRAEAIKTQKQWIAKEDEIETRIKKIEDVLLAKQKVIDDEKDRIKNERELFEQSRLNERAVKLIGLGMNFDGNAYVLDDIKISVIQVKSADDFVWTALLAGVEVKYKESLERKALEEKAKAEAEARAKAIAEEQLAKEEELKRKEAEIAAREQAIKDAEANAKAEAERLIKQKEEQERQQKEAELMRINEQIQAVLKARKSVLFQLGFAQQGDKLMFQELIVTDAQMISISDNDWPAALQNLTDKRNVIAKRIDDERIAKEAEIKRKAEEETRLKIQAEQEKERKEKEAKEAEEKRKAELAPDSQKLDEYLKILYDTKTPVFSTAEYVEIGDYAHKALTQLIKHILTKKPA